MNSLATLGRAQWLKNRRMFLGVFATALLCGLFNLAADTPPGSVGGFDFFAYAPLGASLFLIFHYCSLTESDPRGRFTGFPARLFTLPVSTALLVTAPMLFGIALLLAVYVLWAKLILAPLNRELPIGWPSLYLATAMICYHAVVWSLARFRVARLIVLGVGGAFFQLAWIAFRNDFERALLPWIPGHLPVRPVLCAILVVIGVVAFLIAWASVEFQRRGGSGEWPGWHSLIETAADTLPQHQRRFASPAAAQFWFEWRRHGVLLPLATACVLFIIMAPAPFIAPIKAGTTALLFGWILAVPFLLAFVLGKGLGKPDLWSNEPDVPLFLATRPLGASQWIGAKMKAAAVATLCSWLILVAMTAVWLWVWCDAAILRQFWTALRAFHLTTVFHVALAAGVILILTWRLLVGSLYLGLSGKTWLLDLTACGVFLAIFGSLFGTIPFFQDPMLFHELQRHIDWLPWLLAALLGVKILAALALGTHAHRRGLLTPQTAGRYLAVWLLATVVLLLGACLLARVDDRHRWTLILLALLAVPLLRISIAPLALALNHRR
ncbi:MAG: hypothetical protein AB1705_10195 [Verrucomicrobiota bacterium]